MQKQILDDFEDISGWTAFYSGQAQLDISQAPGQKGKAMRLDFDFHGAGGFVVARKAFSLDIPESYSFGHDIRGTALPNIFEFKLVDKSNQNVWRYRVEEYDFPEQWQPLKIRSSQIDFAWGPLGGGPPSDIAAIELVIAAGPGGKGTVWIEELYFQDDTYSAIPLVLASSNMSGHTPDNVLTPPIDATWRSEASDEPQWLMIDFKEEREFGGLVIQWEKGLQPQRFDVLISTDASTWATSYATSQADSERSYIYLPHCVSRYVRLNLNRAVHGRGFGICRIEIKPHEFSRSINHFFQAIAREHPQGLYPKYFQGRQTYWTTVGTGQGDGQALFNEEGMVEVDKGSFSIMPFLYAADRLITWADVALYQKLENGYLPIPSCRWQIKNLAMKVTAFAAEDSGRSVLYLRYCIENTAHDSQSVTLFAAILPFQVTPTWQNWRTFGGVSQIHKLSYDREAVLINGGKAVIPLTRPSRFGAAAFSEGGVTRFLESGQLPLQTEITDEFGYASAALRFDMDMPPGSTQEVYLAIPFGVSAAMTDDAGTLLSLSVSGPDQFDYALRLWKSRLDTVEFMLPANAQGIADSFKTAAAHILINRDGPALHPGPRRYSRSWIRDSAIMGAALLRIGLTHEIRDFIRWYSAYQAEDGNIPDCADKDGTEWLPEFDAYGQFIHIITEYFRFTGDKTFIEEMWPTMAKALAFMEGLRAKRLTPEYLSPEKRAFYGLLPESMSHEGYMAHPVHAYWDDYWAIRGLGDAAVIADELGYSQEAMRLSELRDSFCKDLRASLTATISRHGIDFVPGSVEFGDFDPTATAIAIILLDGMNLLPEAETDNSFDKYLTGFRKRATGGQDWNNYSAYEIRIIGALIRLGRRQEALELTKFMLDDRRILAWNQWPEISWRDPTGPSFIGDLPHTWISAEYMLAVSSMFAYEREADDSLVIAAGIDQEWLTDGLTIGVKNLPTYYGKISYRLSIEHPDTLHLNLWGDLTLPGGGIVVQPPITRPVQEVTVNGRAITEFTFEDFTCRECPAEVVVKVQEL